VHQKLSEIVETICQQSGKREVVCAFVDFGWWEGGDVGDGGEVEEGGVVELEELGFGLRSGSKRRNS